MTPKNAHVLLYIFMFVVVHATCKILPDIASLYKNITNGYQKEVFPTWNQTQPLDIYFTLAPLVLNSFYATEETISLTTAIYFMWDDLRLTWEPLLYGNKESITITTNDIWLPYIHMENSVDELKAIGHDAQFYARITHNGRVKWTPGGILRAKCPSDIRRFPFDTQTCQFIFAMWGVEVNDVRYIPVTDEAIMTYFTKNSDWTVTANRQFVRYKNITVEFIFELSIKRQPLYNIVVVILPTFVFALMNPLVFLLPVDSGERISLGMTILLSYEIFLTLVSNSVPASSNPICLLLLILVIVMMISGGIVICVICSINNYYIEDVNDINVCVEYLAVCFRQKKCIQLSAEEKTDESESANLSVKDLVKTIDIMFLVISYVLFGVALSVYFIYICSTRNE